MNASRKQLLQWDRDHLWHPFTQMSTYASEEPLIITHAHGCYLVDDQGNEYLDGTSSLWCNIHGHRHQALDQALCDQLDQVAHSTLLGLSHEPAIRLARKLTEIAPEGLSHVFFSDSGATAVVVALKMAFQYWQQRSDPRPDKTKFVTLNGAYHGDTIGAVSVGGVDRFHNMFSPLLFDVHQAPQPHCYRCPLGLTREHCKMDCFLELDRILEQHHNEIAAIILEPIVQGASGMIVAPDGYLSQVRSLATQYDTLLIADEVAVGFGRTGTMFACQHENVSPDLLCLGKGITAGYLPLAATLATDELFSAFLGTPSESKTFYHGHTYSGNPLATAVALENLKLFEQKTFFSDLKEKAAVLKTSLKPLKSHPHIGDIRQKGLIVGIELIHCVETNQAYCVSEQMGVKVCQQAREHGLLIRPLGDVLVLMPPLSMENEQIQHMCQIVHRSIDSITSPTNA